MVLLSRALAHNLSALCRLNFDLKSTILPQNAFRIFLRGFQNVQDLVNLKLFHAICEVENPEGSIQYEALKMAKRGSRLQTSIKSQRRHDYRPN